MNSTLATEVAPQPAALETWAANERMRHIPTVEWMIRKTDVDLRRRLDRILTPFGSLQHDDPHRARIEEQLRILCRAFERVADVAKHSRQAQQGGDIAQRVRLALNHAVENLRTADADLIGRRFPFHTGERSKAEPLYGALLTAISAMNRLVPLVRQIDLDLDERLLEGLVVLENPVDERMLRPIA